jgi:hypothetical protein
MDAPTIPTRDAAAVSVCPRGKDLAGMLAIGG